MKLAASRSLLQGTVPSSRTASARGGGVELAHQVVVAGRDRDAALGHHGPVPALDLEHVEVAVEPLAGVQRRGRPARSWPACRARRRRHWSASGPPGTAGPGHSTAGRYSITGAPTPAAAARTEFRYSLARSIASSSLPPDATLATNAPFTVVILKFLLVSPPGSSVTVRGRLARLGTWSKIASRPACGIRGRAGVQACLPVVDAAKRRQSRLKGLDLSGRTFRKDPRSADKGYGQLDVAALR